MPQSLVQLYLHIVFSTKQRQRFLEDYRTRERTHAYLAGICKHLKCPSLVVGGVDDHVHLLNRHSKNISVADFLRELKRGSSVWIKTLSPTLSSFHWQSGYGAFSISPSDVEEVRSYIVDQDEHHRHESFQDEFRRLCRKYGVEIDERYVWD
jgi:REP element-mobilizing transposase RayT